MSDALQRNFVRDTTLRHLLALFVNQNAIWPDQFHLDDQSHVTFASRDDGHHHVFTCTNSSVAYDELPFNRLGRRRDFRFPIHAHFIDIV